MNNIEESTQKWQETFDEEFRYSEGRDFQALMDDIKDFCAKQIATQRLKFQEEARQEINQIENSFSPMDEEWYQGFETARKAFLNVPSLTPPPQEETKP